MSGNKAKKAMPLQDFTDLLNYDNPDCNAPKTQAIQNVAPVVAGYPELEFNRLKPFPNHIFKLYSGKRLDDMVDSIKRLGITTPLIVWNTENDEYVILSGHNRVNAGKIAGLTKAKVVIETNLTHEDAVLYVTETNLLQRSFADMSHSERALSLAQRYEAIKSQGKRTDIIKEIETLIKAHDGGAKDTSGQVGERLDSREKIGSEYGLSPRNVSRYIRLATLDPTLLDYVDTGKIAFLAGYDISFIEDKAIQSLIADKIKRNGYKVDMKMASLMREYYKSKKLTEDKIEQILSGESTRKPKSDKPKPFQLKSAVIVKHFINGQSKTEIEEIIDKALLMYFSQQQAD
jgi:ParB family chromosome partitioning protein